MAKADRKQSFEELYTQLEESVAKLEQGGLTLDEAIALYERGMQLAKQCQDRLDAAELTITRLKESFAVLPRTSNGVSDDEGVGDYEYVSDEDALDREDPAVLDPEDEAFP